MGKLSILAEEDRSAVEGFSSAVKEILGDRLARFILYGSKARGEGDEESDIDILIVVEGLKDEDETKLDDIAGEIFVSRAILISLIIFDSKNIEWKMGESSPFVKNVLEEGIEIG